MNIIRLLFFTLLALIVSCKTNTNDTDISSFDILIDSNYEILDSHYNSKNIGLNKFYLKSRSLFQSLKDSNNKNFKLHTDQLDSLITKNIPILSYDHLGSQAKLVFQNYLKTKEPLKLKELELIISNYILQHEFAKGRLRLDDFSPVLIHKDSDSLKNLILFSAKNVDYIQCFKGMIDTTSWNITDKNTPIPFDTTYNSFLYSGSLKEHPKYGSALIKINHQNGEYLILPVYQKRK